jgi:Flavin containing amine oxidoreductase
MKRRDFLTGAAAAPLALGACAPARQIEGGFVGDSAERGHLMRRTGAWPAPSKTVRVDVVIAGGGVAGLAASRALRLGGKNDFALLELEDAAGGNSRGTQVSGIACPLGAHYLPVPSDSAAEVQHLLEELGLRRRVAGRWAYDERHLCHSPQERLFIHGQWQPGLLPLDGVDAADLAEYRRFSALVREAAKDAAFSIPLPTLKPKVPLAQSISALDAINFEAWLNQQQLTRAPLRWYLDYCCRDDYGAGIGSVSALAGLAYFASRHGFSVPGSVDEKNDDKEGGVLTWPEGNGWLTQRLAAPLGERLFAGRVVLRIEQLKHGVEVDAFNVRTQQVERYQAERAIVCLPLRLAVRVVASPPAALVQAAAALRYSAWMVANISTTGALLDRPGAAPSWDNVIYPEASANSLATTLGYVDASHQNLKPVPAATVLTHYSAFGIGKAAQQMLLDTPWASWRDSVLAELAVPHPDLPGKVQRIDIMRYGHAMSVPVPGLRGHAGLRALHNTERGQRLSFAHSDLSGYSVFEEAFTHGHRAGSGVF